MSLTRANLRLRLYSLKIFAWWLSHTFADLRCPCGLNVRTFAVGATYYSHDLTSGFMAYHEYPTKEEATVAVLQKLDWLVDIHAPHLPNRDDFEEEMTWH